MKIALASDHGGLELKNHLVKFLQENGYETIDFGTNSLESCDYPDYAYKAALSIKNGEADLGIVVCTSGIGVSIVANKVQTVRCALVTCVEDAISSKEHNHANCLAMGQRRVSKELAEKIVLAWLNTSYGEGRHERRVEKIKALEV